MENVLANMNEAEGTKKIDKVQAKEKEIRRKIKSLDISKFKKLFNQITLALELIKDYRAKTYTKLPWRTITILALALLYFLNPFDLIPDYIPGVGYIDDALTVAAIFKSLQVDLSKYCKFKGYEIEKYF